MRNKLLDIIKKAENENFIFKTTPKFYEIVEIRQRRFGQILRNEAQPDLIELKNLADYFKVHYTELIDEHGRPEGVEIAEGLTKAWKQERRGRKKKQETKVVSLKNNLQVA